MVDLKETFGEGRQLGMAEAGEDTRGRGDAEGLGGMGFYKEYSRSEIREIIQRVKGREDPLILWVKEPQGKEGTLGVFPASFNPPTLAHLHLVKEAKRRFSLQEVALILDTRPMDKEIVGAPLEDRVLMLLGLFGKRGDISIGICNEGLFVGKLKALQALMPEARVRFIMGYDTMVRLFDPRYYQDMGEALWRLFGGADLLVGLRGEVTRDEVRAFLSLPEVRPYAERIHLFDLPPSLKGISSTQVRERVKRGESISQLVPPSVEEFIREKGLYEEEG